MDNQLKNHIIDFLCDKFKCDNIKIVNVYKYDGETIYIKYMSIHITSSSKEYSSIEYSSISTYVTTERELKEFIRNNKINKILHNENS